MNVNADAVGIKKLRLYAVTGAKTKNGGKIIGSSTMSCNGLSGILQGDQVIYPDNTTAKVLPDPTTRMMCEVDGQQLTAAAVGTMIDNGDDIVEAAQNSMAIITFDDDTVMCGYIDEEEYETLKVKGVIL